MCGVGGGGGGGSSWRHGEVCFVLRAGGGGEMIGCRVWLKYLMCSLGTSKHVRDPSRVLNEGRTNYPRTAVFIVGL